MVVLSIIAAFTGAITWYLFKTYYKEEPLPPMPEPVIPEPPPVPDPEPIKNWREALYDTAYKCRGREMSPLDFADDEVGCAESLEGVIYETTGWYISGDKKPLLSTYVLKQKLDKDKRFQRVETPLPGDIRLYVTGLSKLPNTPVKNGHVLIEGKTHCMSNQSFTNKNGAKGTWQANYTPAGCKAYWEVKGGYNPYFYRLVKVV